MIEKPVEPFYYENRYFVIRQYRRDQTLACAPEYIGEQKSRGSLTGTCQAISISRLSQTSLGAIQAVRHVVRDRRDRRQSRPDHALSRFHHRSIGAYPLTLQLGGHGVVLRRGRKELFSDFALEKFVLSLSLQTA
jgi:hypothetical protein